ERLLAVVRLGDEQIVGADTAGARPRRIERVLRVDEGGGPARLLRRRDRVESERGLSGRFRAVDLDHPAAREAADAERHVHGERAGRDDVDLLAGSRAELHDRALPELLLDLLHRLLDRARFLCYSHLLLLSAPKNNGAGLLHTGAASLASVFSGVARHQVSFSFRFGFTISKVMGWTGCATPFRFSSFSSCSLDFFFLFLSLASPRPDGIGPSNKPRGKLRGTSRAYRDWTALRADLSNASLAPSLRSGSSRSVTGAARLSGVPTRPRRPSARVATRTGDRGETSLFGKARVRKTDPRIEALGDLDETQAVIGLARSLAPRSSL